MDQPGCPACGGALFCFTVPDDVKCRVDRGLLPAACRTCGKLSVSGRVIELPAAFTDQVKQVAEDAAREAAQAKNELLQNPEARIAKYFDRVWRSGFTAGLVRAIAFFRHQRKEGRIRRLRALWQVSSCAPGETGRVLVDFDHAAYLEFDQLLRMSDAEDHENQRSAGPTGDSPV